MPRFDFKLEPLLRYRERIEEFSRREYAEALRLLDEERGKLDELEALYLKACGELDALKARGELDRWTMYSGYLSSVKEHIAGQRRIIDKVEAHLAEKRAALAEAAREKKLIETMKEKALKLHARRVDRAEQRLADELYLARFKKGSGDAL
ncbi:MAG TPA: flagellar export protein FliJ [Deltaproteobacteria bacterium]|nr:flagellar export protein FliJ [Deltaproteobacteria bacterium]